MAIIKKFLGADQVDGSKLLLLNSQSLRGKDSLGESVDLLKLTSSNVLELQKLPRVASGAAAISDDKDLITKEYLDDILGGGAGNGFAPLGEDGKIPNQYYSSLVISDVFVVADIAARDALSEIEEGDIAKVTNAGSGLPKTYIWGGSSWIEIESGSDVDTVNGYTGTVVLATSDIAESGSTNLYYTPTRQSAIEQYADQAEADAISSANSYTDGEITTLEGSLQGYADQAEADAISSANSYTDGEITTLEGSLQGYADQAEADAIASANSYADGIVSTEQGARVAEDLTFVKLDGSRNITGAIKFSMGAGKYIDFLQGDGYVGGLATPVDSDHAANKGYVDQAETDAVASAATYTDGQLDLLAVEQLVHESFTLSSGQISAGKITVAHTIVGKPMVMVGRVVLLPTEDFTVSGADITWAGPVASAGAEALEAGDKVHVYYHKSVNPFV